MALPQLPASHKDFISYVTKQRETPVRKLVQPFNEYEAKLRELFAQSRDDDATADPHINVVPVYAGQENNLTIKARNVDDDHESEKYIMPLKTEARKAEGYPAVVETFNGFKKNFNLFSESSLADLDWDNVVVAGSAVVTSLLPVSEEHRASTRALRTYYHEELAPSSDVDLFLWGLSEEEAIEKIKSIETSVKNSILAETTTIRTKHAITIVSQYPTRHVQIVLRIYKSISEILTGFDVDCSCFAYDGSQVYGTPRGIAAFLTQCNVIDLSRRSPSYENRLSKYAARGFEIFCQELDRDRIDPTIYDRAFARVQGLARLLVLERLPKESDREIYRARRRRERARPAIGHSWKRNQRKLRDNFKDKDPQDVAEWVMEEQDDISNYHSFTIPYGPRYNAKKIEKLVYTKDLLLNAEWNSKKERTVNLHRHPCFVGDAEFIMTDCCTTCPEPKTIEEKEVAEEESRKYVSRNIEFIKDDPGRQTIGSFYPLTSADWTHQAYLGNMESLCQGIVDGNLDFIQEWCKSFDIKADNRDHTGRTPLHLACQVGSTEVVRILVNAGARIISRLTDGITALHIACIRGDIDIINILLEKSEANEEIEAEKADLKRKKDEVRNDVDETGSSSQLPEENDDNSKIEADASDEEVIDLADEQSDAMSMTQGSFVKVPSPNKDEEVTMDKEDLGPDVYDINILAWDAPVSPLHLAIICGHTEVIRLLVSKFGADVLLPVKRNDDMGAEFPDAILTLVLAARNVECSVEMTEILLDLGASPSQSDVAQFSAIHSVALIGNIEAMKMMIEKDLPRAHAALKHIIIDNRGWRNFTMTPLTSAIQAQDKTVSKELLKAGTPTNIPYDEWAKVYMASSSTNHQGTFRNKATAREAFDEVAQPIVYAAANDLPEVVEVLLDMGVDINQLDSNGLKLVNQTDRGHSRLKGQTVLDIIEAKANIPSPSPESIMSLQPPILLSQHQYLHHYAKESYQHWQIQNQYVLAEELLKDWDNLKDKSNIGKNNSHGSPEDLAKAQRRLDHYKKLKARLIASGAKTFKQLHPSLSTSNEHDVATGSSTAQPIDTAPKTLNLIVDFEIPSVHDINTEGYIQLFEAVWRGDKEKIKALTTKPDGEGNVLRIAVHDNMGISPLHIAIWRGEYEIADLMLEIAHLQYAPDNQEDKPKRRYNIRSIAFDDYDSDADDDEGDFFVSSELVDQEFTIDDVAKLANQVGSKSQAIDFLSWSGQFWMFASLPGAHSASSLGKMSTSSIYPWLERWHKKQTSVAFFQDHFADRSNQNKSNILNFAIDTGDIDLVRLITKWYNIYAPLAVKPKNPRAFSEHLTPDNKSYVFRALRLGYSDIASELVGNFGCEMPVQSLMDEAGVQDPDTAKYYQGLLVRGKHKKDWVKEANKTADTGSTQDSLRTSLFLNAISNNLSNEGLAVIEWCLSDSPQRLLIEWLSQNKDKRVQDLVGTNGGPEELVTEWLGTRQNLAIHMAVLSSKWKSDKPKERKEAAEILKYLIRVLPESLEAKNINGYTPLALAFWTKRTEAASILISAGANQATRDYNGANIVHLALLHSGRWSKENASELEQCLALIDRTVLTSLFVERCSLGPTGTTPLGLWLWKLPNPGVYNSKPEGTDEAELSVFETILKYMDYEPLRMVDGGGQMPLHTCVKENFVHLLEYLCDIHPELVLLENGMGQTALELCYSIFIGEAVNPANSSPAKSYSRWNNMPLRDKPFQEPLRHGKTLELLKKTQLMVYEKPRILISSLQASEVAKRLADSQTKIRESRPISYGRRSYGAQDRRDEVERWLEDNSYRTG